MTSGPVYGQGFVELEPQLSRDFLAKINQQLDRAFSNIKLNVDDSSIRSVRSQLDLVEGSADRAAKEVGQIAREAGASVDDFKLLAKHMDISEDEARRLATEVGKAQVETRQLDDAAQRVAKSLGLSQSEARRFADQMNRAADSGAAVSRLDTTIGNLRSSLSRAALAAVAFFGVRGVLNQAQAAREAFINLGESVNAVQVVFGDASDVIFRFADRVAQSAGLARSEFQQMSTVLGAALQNAGLTADEAAKKTITLTQRAADLASVFNTDVADALGAIQAALRGESDPIERFGVTLSAAKVDAEAAALGFSKVAGEFDATAKTAARLSLIMEQTDRVANDFSNTSDSLANRQRIAAAEMENVRAELGEALLPVFERLVDIGPRVVEGLEDMAPALAALAESTANLLESTPGIFDFMDALNLITDLPRGFGQVGDVIRSTAEVLGGVPQVLNSLFSGDFVGAFRRTGEVIEGLGDEAQRTLERINTQGLIDDLREGGDAASTLANRLAEVARKGKLDPRFIRGLAQIAGTSFEETTATFVALINDAERLRLSTDEIDALRIALGLLQDEAQPDGPIRGISARIREIPDAVASAIPRIGDFRRAVEDTGLSLEELAFSADPAAQTFRDALKPSEELALTLEAVGSSAEVAAGFLDAALRPAIADAGQALKDLNSDGKVTASEYIQSLAEMTRATLQFTTDLAAIAAIDPDVAAQLATLPIEEALELIREFAANPAQIRSAAEAMFGTPKQLEAAILDIWLNGLDALEDPEAAAKFLALTRRVFEESVPGVTEAISGALQPALDVSFADLEVPDLGDQIEAAFSQPEAAGIGARVTTDAYRREVINDLAAKRFGFTGDIGAEIEKVFGAIDINLDFTEEGVEARATFMAGLSAGQAAEEQRLHDSIEGVLNDAIQKRSPPKLFADAGEESGHAFWDSFSGVALDFPGIDLARSLGASRAHGVEDDLAPASAFGGPAIENVNFYDTREKPAEESLQEAGARVAVMLNLRK